MQAVSPPGPPAGKRASGNSGAAIAFLRHAPGRCAGPGARALTGLTRGGTGECRGLTFLQAEEDTRDQTPVDAAAAHARKPVPAFGIEPAKRHENRLCPTPEATGSG
jgi:D-psicose/D-tagatose/L-ribulose 3-epimerase